MLIISKYHEVNLNEMVIKIQLFIFGQYAWMAAISAPAWRYVVKANNKYIKYCQPWCRKSYTNSHLRQA